MCTYFQSRDPMSESEVSAEINMSVPARVVLLQCGSYNPITNMHLRMFGKLSVYMKCFLPDAERDK